MRSLWTSMMGSLVSGSISSTSLVVLGHLVGELASSTVTSLYWTPQRHLVQYNSIQYNTDTQYNTMQYRHSMQYNTVQTLNTIQYNTDTQYNAVQTLNTMQTLNTTQTFTIQYNTDTQTIQWSTLHQNPHDIKGLGSLKSVCKFKVGKNIHHVGRK